MSFLTKLPIELYDRNAFQTFTATSSFDLGTAKGMAWLMQLAYETDEPQKIEKILQWWGLQLLDAPVSGQAFRVLQTADTHCFAVSGHGCTIVVFAGTDPLNLPNWRTNFDFRIINAGIAEGYRVAANAILEKLIEILGKRTTANRKVFLVGHSLGGALAVVTAHQLAMNPEMDIGAVYTFGMPRAGDQSFADAYNRRLGPRTYRLVHGDDLVPSVAPTGIGFRHLGRHLRCARKEKFDSAKLSADTDSDEPLFVEGIMKEFSEIQRAPFLYPQALARQWFLPTNNSIRSDLAGIAIEMLPPRLRDHIPDRYIGAF